MSETRVIVLRTHQAFWTRKRGYGLTEEGAVIEFEAPSGMSPTSYFGGLMDLTRAAMPANCFGERIDDGQIAREVSRPLKPEEARQLFQKTIWGVGPPPSYGPPTMDVDDHELVIRASRSF